MTPKMYLFKHAMSDDLRSFFLFSFFFYFVTEVLMSLFTFTEVSMRTEARKLLQFLKEKKNNNNNKY